MFVRVDPAFLVRSTLRRAARRRHRIFRIPALARGVLALRGPLPVFLRVKIPGTGA